LESLILKLAKDSTERYILDTIQQCQEKLETMHLTENWVLGSYTARSNGSSRITTLPSRVQRLLADTLTELKGVMIASNWYADLICHKTFGCLITLGNALKSLVPPEQGIESNNNILLALSNTIYIRTNVIPFIHNFFDNLFGDSDDTK
jgi:hypothetical protein